MPSKFSDQDAAVLKAAGIDSDTIAIPAPAGLPRAGRYTPPVPQEVLTPGKVLGNSVPSLDELKQPIIPLTKIPFGVRGHNLDSLRAKNPNSIPAGIMHGLGQSAESLTTPASVATGVATAVAPEWLALPAGAWFTTQAGKQFLQSVPAAKKAFDEGRYGDVADIAAQAGVNLGAAVAGTRELANRTVPMLKRPFTPSPEQATINATADKYNVPMTLGARSGKPLVQMAESGLEKTPLASIPIRAARRASNEALDAALSSNVPAVTPDRFQDIAAGSLASQRAAHAADVKGAVDAAGSAISPNGPVDTVTAGREAQGAVNAARDRFHSQADELYNNLRASHGKDNIDLTPMVERGAALEDQLPQGSLQKFLPAGLLSKLKAVASADQSGAVLDQTARNLGGNSAADLPPQLLSSIKDALPAPTLTLTQALSIRPALTSILRSSSDGIQRHVAGQILDALDQSLSNSLSGEAAAQHNAARSYYSQGMSNLYGPMAKSIADRTPYAEDVPGKVDQPGAVDRIQALRDSTAAPGEQPTPLPGLERNAFDKIVDGATNDGRVSPNAMQSTFRKYGPGTMQGLFKSNYDRVTNVANPSLVGRETELFGNPLTNTIDKGAPNATLARVFPRGNPNAVTAAGKFFDATGNRPEMQGAAYHDLLNQSLNTDRAAGTDRVIDPAKLEKLTADYGPSVDALLEPDQAQALRDLTQVGKATRSGEAQYGNTSGTARSAGVLGALASIPYSIMNPHVIPAEAATAAATWGAGKFLASPGVARSLTAPQPPVPAVRVPFVLTQPPVVQPQQRFSNEDAVVLKAAGIDPEGTR